MVDSFENLGVGEEGVEVIHKWDVGRAERCRGFGSVTLTIKVVVGG